MLHATFGTTVLQVETIPLVQIPVPKSPSVPNKLKHLLSTPCMMAGIVYYFAIQEVFLSQKF